MPRKPKRKHRALREVLNRICALIKKVENTDDSAELLEALIDCAREQPSDIMLAAELASRMGP